MMDRQQHLEWCKSRARQYVKAGQYADAVASMMSDLGKHDETRAAASGILGMMGIMAAQSGNRDEVLRYIEGFN